MISFKIRSILLLGFAVCFGIIAMLVNVIYGQTTTMLVQLLGLGMLITAVLGVYSLQKKPKTCQKYIQW